MKLTKTMENVFAAVAFAESNDHKTASYIASGKAPAAPKPKAKKVTTTDKRARLRM